MYLKNSRARRDLPTPATPELDSACRTPPLAGRLRGNEMRSRTRAGRCQVALERDHPVLSVWRSRTMV